MRGQHQEGARMNNNEAKKTILEAESCFCKHGAYKDCHSGCKYREALDAAVKALEQEPTITLDVLKEIREEIGNYKLSPHELEDMDEDSIKWGMKIAYDIVEKYER